MTNYPSPGTIYERTLKQLIQESPSEADCMARKRELLEEATRVDEEMKRPDWIPPVVSYIPNYGIDETIQAITDFDKLRSLLTVDSFFRQFLFRQLEIEE